MSIIIHGMKMPKFGDCIVITSDGVASKYLAGDVAIYYDAHPDKASAIELSPHGRMIDADALFAERYDSGLYRNAEIGSHQMVVDWEDIEDATTIIPAEGGVDG